MPEWAAECCRTRLSRWEPAVRRELDDRAQQGKGRLGKDGVLACTRLQERSPVSGHRRCAPRSRLRHGREPSGLAQRDGAPTTGRDRAPVPGHGPSPRGPDAAARVPCRVLGHGAGVDGAGRGVRAVRCDGRPTAPRALPTVLPGGARVSGPGAGVLGGPARKCQADLSGRCARGRSRRPPGPGHAIDEHACARTSAGSAGRCSVAYTTDFGAWIAPVNPDAPLPAVFAAPATRYVRSWHETPGRRPCGMCSRGARPGVRTYLLSPRWSLLHITLRLVRQLLNLYRGHTAVTVLAHPFLATLDKAAPQLKRWPSGIKVRAGRPFDAKGPPSSS